MAAILSYSSGASNAAAFDVVEVLAPADDDSAGLGAGAEMMPGQHLMLEGGEERLRGGVIETRPDLARDQRHLLSHLKAQRATRSDAHTQLGLAKTKLTQQRLNGPHFPAGAEPVDVLPWRLFRSAQEAGYALRPDHVAGPGLSISDEASAH